MKNTKTYIKEFKTEKEAMQMMSIKNRSLKLANNSKELYCVVNGTLNNFAVVDIRTAVELDNGYKIN